MSIPIPHSTSQPTPRESTAQHSTAGELSIGCFAGCDSTSVATSEGTSVCTVDSASDSTSFAAGYGASNRTSDGSFNAARCPD